MKNPIAPNTKIRILSPEHSEYVQKLAFDAGFKWFSGACEISNTDEYGLFFRNNMEITYVADKYLFDVVGELKEIFIDLPAELMTAEYIKKFNSGADVDLSEDKVDFIKDVLSGVGKDLERIINKSDTQNSCSDLDKGQKHDTDKPRYDLMPVHAEAAVVDVLTFGAKKYAPDNWRHVESATERYTAAALRHIAAYRMGEHEDKESGLPHLAHAVCCLMFMLELDSEADK